MLDAEGFGMVEIDNFSFSIWVVGASPVSVQWEPHAQGCGSLVKGLDYFYPKNPAVCCWAWSVQARGSLSNASFSRNLLFLVKRFKT